MRLSSTPLGCFLTCQRKLWEEHSGHPGSHPVQSNEMMAFGTIFHAFAEFRQTHGRWPSSPEFNRMEGNYDDPRVARDRYPHLYQPALDTAMWVEENHPECFEQPADARAEVPLSEFGLSLAGSVAGGYIDLFVPSQQKIVDWKTRGGFHYVPRTKEDFFADPQLCYYAAAVALAMGWETVTVEHWNVLRPDKGGPAFMLCSVDLPAYYLRGVWRHLEDIVVPAMQVVHGTLDPQLVERSVENCYSKGPCAHLPYCLPSYTEEEHDPFALLLGDDQPVDPFAILNQE